MNSVTLSFLIDNMDVYRDIANIEQQYKVRAIDTQLREIRRRTSFPWNLKKATLKIFKDVYEYPIAEDHGELAYIDKQNINNYADAARFHNTSLQQFYENVNETRNNLSDIWKDGQRMIGVNLRSESLSSVEISDASDVTDYSQSLGDPISAITSDDGIEEGAYSVRFSTSSSSTVMIENTFDIAISDEDYLKKHYFVEIYMENPASEIFVRLVNDSSNYITKSISAQFDGRPFVSGWNIIAADLREAVEVGTFDYDNITGDAISIVHDDDVELFKIGRTYLKDGMDLDYWYYSLYNVVSEGSTAADKEYFIEKTGSSADINLEDSLIGDTKWIDFVIYGAMRDLAAELENDKIKGRITEKFSNAESDFNDQHPNMTPLITTKRRNFNNEPGLAYQTYDNQ